MPPQKGLYNIFIAPTESIMYDFISQTICHQIKNLIKVQRGFKIINFSQRTS